MRTSYSALTTYQQCPLRFKFQEIDRIRVPKGFEAIFGSIIHSCLKFMFERSPLYPTVDQVIDHFQNQWQDNKVANLKPQADEEKAHHEEGIEILKKFYKKNQPWNFDVVDLESRFEVLIPDPETGEQHILAGIIDRIDKNQEKETFEIIDYKTSKRMPSQENLDKDLQMSIYHLGISRRWPHVKPGNIKLSLYFLKHGEKITTSRSQEDLEKTKIFVIGLIREIKGRLEKKDFPPYPTALCGWCGYKPMCPMFKHFYLKKSEPKSQEEINSAVREYFELKNKNQENNKRIAEIQALIYQFMKQESVDRVFGENGYLTKALQERLVYDMKKIKEILEEMGKWDEVTTKKQFPTLKASKLKKKTGV